MKRSIAAASTIVTLAAAPAWAHHAFAEEFDTNAPIELRGVVTKVELINPHTWIHIDVKGPDGKTVSWMIEAGSPNALMRRGFTKGKIAPGTNSASTSRELHGR